ncbi:MAG: hypothetical protein JRI39_00370 [Deltaproteobacteria bacterium]|nr:hypothetical protein [Deltaproteobacteria bacterium]
MPQIIERFQIGSTPVVLWTTKHVKGWRSYTVARVGDKPQGLWRLSRQMAIHDALKRYGLEGKQ